MIQRLSHPSLLSLETLLKLCKSEIHLNQIHARIIRKGLEQDQNLVSIFISSSSSSLSYSSSVFERVPYPGTYLWNHLIKGYSKKFLFFETVSILMRMMRTGFARPDEYTFPLVMKVCSNNGEFRVGSTVHGLVLRIGFDKDVVLGTSFVDFYGKCKDLCSARKVFGEMPERNVVSWTALIVAYVKSGELEEAKKMFDLMPERNLGSWNALVDGLVKSGDLVNARKLFDEMPNRDIISYTCMIDGYAKGGDMVSAKDLFEKARGVDVRAWSALILGYAQNGQPNEAFKVFSEMCAKNVKPDEFIMVGLMSACSQMGCFELCEKVDSYLHQSMNKFSSHYVIPALIDMNAKCGHMDRAAKLFEEMPQRDLVSYCSMMEGMAIHGCGSEAVRLFEKMVDEGIVPDEVAFTVILKVCSQSRLVEEGLRYFELMRKEYSILASPDHYSCIVNLLSRTGKLKEAYELIKSMPFEAHASAWGSLLGGCSLHGNTEIAEVVARQLFELEPQSAGSYVLLSNIYAALDRWADVAHLRDKMNENGIKKICGRSWISR
ncbi:Pentatricopeptide repeat [Arabidopsis thaliana x Arabidopsis arenosa]|uniref:Pentatricopeptide repeat n=1 Tax=Arabidopsis thaliana x Arabidopsis arenosa TaxID=1240361 RepID=A0A8T1YC89_9BRAS|nr:Pentatricopeptide repeat [Arabidopsis thaliana x Arabidopsis arenosa]KAG7543639.1 Pentatricopeptide repeat [Arabidopsis thaliana x Arabidopsis arenosa]KAG7543640.1 Pentatricopeptide repeat [Arabidopsis thaliana x Arabidopsis arenosa]KAG7543641.1 Pentatricopeptide repeat [Arabidopsis thaliana x Arabidopsis arenosa]KAG7543642.1 Pentatricopeptide repeat [Arabidopsis thaliana x Arabidopsis arenosa]